MVRASCAQPGGEDLAVLGLGGGVVTLPGQLFGEVTPADQHQRGITSEAGQLNLEDLAVLGLSRGVVSPR